MKVIKPRTLGLLHKPRGVAGETRLVLAGVGFFGLGGGEDFLAEGDAWPRVLPLLPAEQPWDMIVPKVRGEVLAAAAAHAPGGRPVREMTVRLALATVDKTLRVRGDRAWSYGLMPFHAVGEAAPFQRMPIVWERAHGGPGHPGNPSGRGYVGPLAGLRGDNAGLLPNLEYPQQDAGGHRRPLTPAGFGPLDIRWQPRAGRAGKPIGTELGADADPALFNAAPEDQWIEGWFQGGEAYRLEGLHPLHPVLQGFLPRQRLRALIQFREGETVEAVMAWDTVWLFPEVEIGMAVFHGEVPVRDSEAADVEALLLAHEHALHPPRPLAHYRVALEQRLGGPRAAAHLADERPLKPEPDAARAVFLEQERLEEARSRRERAQSRLRAVHQELGLEGAAPEPAPPLLAVPCAAALARGEAEVAGVLEQVDALIETTRAEAAAHRAELDLPNASAIPPRSLEEALASLDAPVSREMLLGRRASPTPIPAPLGREDAARLGQEIRRRLAAGESLAGRDLAGADLRGIDLTAANLAGTLLEGADLSLARLAGADLAGAALAAACLAGADLSGASLHAAGCHGADFRGARLRQADLRAWLARGANLVAADLADARLDRAVLLEADLSDACLDRAQLDSTLLLQVRARGSTWRGARLQKAVLYQAELEGADFTDARLSGALLVQARARRSRWNGARLDGCFCVAADFSEADFTAMRAEASGWRDGQLPGACLAGGRFSACDFSGANLEGADLTAAVFPRAILQRSNFRRVRGHALDLFQAQARKADFRGADLQDARFVQTDRSEART